ncbi:MAG: caspase domain-containing protein [Rhizobiaceae bacterium]
MSNLTRIRPLKKGMSLVSALASVFIALVALMAAPAAALAGKRVALVIGNSAYENAGQLTNPANDASDMAATLTDLGFTVITGTDLDNRGMRDKVREFSNELRGAEAAMLFYAGHAMQVNGKNYLAPVDTRLEYESDLDFETIPLQFIQNQMEREAKTILLFLDACRDNPLTRSFKVASRSQGSGNGLAEEKLSSSGILIAFSTNPDNVALDGKGRNSPFTKALLDNIKRPGVEISTLMTDVRVQVVKDTDGAQTPWINSALLGRFYFNPDAAASSESSNQQVASVSTSSEQSSSTAASTPSPSAAGVDNARIAALAFDTVKDSNSIDELEAFLSVYGSTFYGKLANIRLDRLKADKAAQETAAKPEEKPAEVAEKPAEGTPSQEETKVASLEQPEAKESTRNLAPTVDEREVKRSIQEQLVRLNCNPGKPDGLWGKRSQGALDTFARSAKLQLASANPDQDLLEQLKGYNGNGCPVRAQPKTCPPGQKLSSKGNCYTPRQEARAEPKTCPPGQLLSRKGNCFTPRQQQPQQQQVFIEQPPQQQVIIQQQQPVFSQPSQPAPQPSLGQRILGGAVIGGTVCILTGC